ncbi:lysophospholipid acyltransferase family protein [Chthonobacter albigriseus]|uniref:lysophospholipid acyltransferase family protein n=1 Tax=Chthonobacter albigriseus TaxID=1683161 RepID=UPI0015EE7021|nr:lysophospholipid acyltransferase family protein [Chthonobacter albigriseus]
MVLRTFIFNVLFYLVTAGALIVCSPVVLFLKPPQIMSIVRWWANTVMALHRAVLGIRHEIRGREHIPTTGAIVAAKHQSTWETMALIPLVPDPVFILKRELMWLPLFGWWASRARMIPVDRGKGSQALADMTERAREAVRGDRQIMIFPEGTRREAGAEPRYKIGVAYLYRDLKVPIVPVALNSGVFWPRRTPSHVKGTIVMEFLPPIAPGLEPKDALVKLQSEVEAASDRLLLEAADGGAALRPEAAARVTRLRQSAAA